MKELRNIYAEKYSAVIKEGKNMEDLEDAILISVYESFPAWRSSFSCTSRAVYKNHVHGLSVTADRMLRLKGLLEDSERRETPINIEIGT